MTARKPKPVAPSREVDRDTRPPVTGASIARALPAAAWAVATALDTEHPRFAGHACWAALRSAFHTLPDPVRREALVRLVLEEADRIDYDAGLAWAPADRHARTAHTSGG